MPKLAWRGWGRRRAGARTRPSPPRRRRSRSPCTAACGAGHTPRVERLIKRAESPLGGADQPSIALRKIAEA